MSDAEVFKAKIHLQYCFEGEEENEQQQLYVQRLAEDRLVIKFSSSIIDTFKLYFGDEIMVRPIGDMEFELISVVQPSNMRHFFFLGSGGSPSGMTDGLHELGGEWETEMGGLTTFHIPRDRIKDFAERFGLNPESGQELTSGVEPWDEEGEKPVILTPQPETPKPKPEDLMAKPVSGTSKHIVLLGDSIIDNHTYVPDGPAVIDHMRNLLSEDWQATLIARDGDMVKHIEEQLLYVPDDATHVVLSIGGNDALHSAEVLSRPTDTVRTAVLHLHEIRCKFRRAYRAMLWMLLSLKKPLAVCTIYDAIPNLSPELQTTLCIFNDTIVREAMAAKLPVIDLRCVCTEADDYSELSPIEPSGQGGGKIARAIAEWATGI